MLSASCSTSLGARHLGAAGLAAGPAGRRRGGCAGSGASSRLGLRRGPRGIALPAVRSATGVVTGRRRGRSPDAFGYMLLVDRRSGSSAGSSSRRAGRRDERRRLYVIGVLFLARGALLVGLRAGRLDAQPVRRPQHRRNDALRRGLPEQLVAVAERAASSSCSRRSSPGCGCASAADDPSSPAKFALGLLFVGLGFAILIAGRAAGRSAAVQVSPLWLVGDVPPAHDRRAVPQPGRPQRDDEARARRASSA